MRPILIAQVVLALIMLLCLFQLTGNNGPPAVLIAASILLAATIARAPQPVEEREVQATPERVDGPIAKGVGVAARAAGQAAGTVMRSRQQ
jgi:hypothetical protein